MLEPSLRSDINKLLTKHYNVDEFFYNSAGKAFLGWLSDFGVPISAAVDMYSPAGKIMYGDLVEKDQILESSRVDSVYFEDIFNDYKNLIKGE